MLLNYYVLMLSVILLGDCTNLTHRVDVYTNATNCTNNVGQYTNTTTTSSNCSQNVNITSALNNTTQSETNETDITKFTLKQICELFQIPEELCKCPGVGVAGICDVYKEKSEENFVCSNRIVDPVITIVVAFFGLIGNTLVMMVTEYRWRTSPLSTKLIGALALSDYVFSLFVLIDKCQELWSCKWLYGLAMCKIIRPLTQMTSATGLGFILIISIERYYGIVHPFSQTVTSEKIYKMCFFNVVFSLVLVVPEVYSITLSSLPLCVEKWPYYSFSLAYSWIWMVFTFLIPVIAISSLYIGLVRSIRASQKNAQKSFSATQKSIRQHEDNRITIILASLLVSFVVLVLPNRILWVLKDHRIYDSKSEENGWVIHLIGELPYVLHAAINPAIYSIVDTNFRKNLRLAFLRIFDKESLSRARNNSVQHSSNTIDSGL